MDRCIYLFKGRNFSGSRKTIYYLNKNPIDLTDFNVGSFIILRGKWQLFDLPGAQGSQIELKPGFYPDSNSITIGNRTIKFGSLASLRYVEDYLATVTRDNRELVKH